MWIKQITIIHTLNVKDPDYSKEMALDISKRCSCSCNRKCVLQFLKNNKLILLTVLGVLVGGIFGLVLRQFDVPDDVKVNKL